MRLTVLGATGRTGVHVLDQALAAGNEVTAAVRNRHAPRRRRQDPSLRSRAGHV
jgi:uncharacterized protein YbjT (DUF2867 family)